MPNVIDWLVQNEPSFRKSRLPSLFSDLAIQKTTNPDGYAANVSAWQAALTRAALAGELPFETRLTLQASNSLLEVLTSRQYGQPSGLGAVLDDSVRSGKMIDLKEFTTAEKSIYSRTWVPSAWSILQWSLRQIGLGGGRSYDDSGWLRAGTLVLVQALEEVGKQVLVAQAKRGQSLTDRLISRETFARDLNVFGGEALSTQDQEVLLRYLQRDKQALSFDAKTVKFKASTSAQPEPITAEDTTIANLKLLLQNLESQVTALQTRIKTLQSKAQVAVKSGSKSSALSALRSKKLAERSLEQRTATLTQLEEVYSNIEQAVDQVEVVQAMEASAGVLKSLNQKVGGVERVEEVVDRLREEMGKVDEVGQVINEPLDQKAILDEEDVDEELAAMEAEQKAAEYKIRAEETKRLEEIEAQKTKKRLEELENAFGHKEEDGKITDTEDSLETSTTRLRGMSIEDDAEKSRPAAQQQEKTAEQA